MWNTSNCKKILWNYLKFQAFLSVTLTIVTSIVSLVPLLISHNSTKSGGCKSAIILTRRVPSSVRKLKQMPSTDVPICMIRFSISIVIRAQFSSSTAWFGQHSIGAGNFGGATRRDGSKLLQSPRGVHGGAIQLSCSVGTQTSCKSQPLVILDRRQFFRPHQIFEHFGLPFTQMHELQLVSSSCWWSGDSEGSALYGDSVVVFKHTDDGSDNTVKFIKFTIISHTHKNRKNYIQNIPISHLEPRLPFGQMHVYPPMPSIQVAPPKHGCGEHSFTLIRQSGPEKPCAHAQRNQVDAKLLARPFGLSISSRLQHG